MTACQCHLAHCAVRHSLQRNAYLGVEVIKFSRIFWDMYWISFIQNFHRRRGKIFYEIPGLIYTLKCGYGVKHEITVVCWSLNYVISSEFMFLIRHILKFLLNKPGAYLRITLIKYFCDWCGTIKESVMKRKALYSRIMVHVYWYIVF